VPALTPGKRKKTLHLPVFEPCTYHPVAHLL